MTAGHLREQNGIYQIVLSWQDDCGKRKTKSVSTGLPIKGNKRRAEALLSEARESFDPKKKLEDALKPRPRAEELQLTVGGAEREGERRLWRRSHLLLALLCAALAAVICALMWYGSTMRITVSDTDIFDKGDGTYETLTVFCPGGGAAALDGGPGPC